MTDEQGLTASVVERLGEIYSQRFPESEAAAKNAMWQEICGYLQRFVPSDSAVLDLACDRGDFIRNIGARERWASDVRDVSQHLPDAIRFVQANGLSISSAVPQDHFDVVFMSNYLEHLPSSDAVLEQLTEVATILKRGGRAIVLQPNIRLTGPAYWDFIDHKVALTERSLVEACELTGFAVEELITRFLPYTTRGRLPVNPLLVRWYLRFPPAWRILGQQTLLVAHRA